ncbi:hypothetical protein BJ508DRAFT_411809 [Ascobolus immersus RN42]|uniref:BTB domain-containing protein n=1 Tax=Ascobolus immersus RN42 TaxID=1160509 RepID=A0A3N4IW40_ASCIM|nr:hypothetical protein BJ508DRAFT_411809 [Ascobolus immersus RN42]
MAGSSSSLSRKRTFAESFGEELICVIFAPTSTLTGLDPEPRKYLIHALKLKEASEYFAGLLRFPGVESERKEVRLDEGYEGLEDAWESFTQYLYTGRLSTTDITLLASMIVLAERLVAAKLKRDAIDALETALYWHSTSTPATPPCPGRRVKFRVPVQTFVGIIRTIYHGTHRPYEQPSTQKERKTKRFVCSHTFNRAQRLDGRLGPDWQNCKETACLDTLHKGTNKVDRDFPRYRNCRARNIVARYAASQLASYRESRDFLAVVEDIGEFASDILMQRLDVEELPCSSGSVREERVNTYE